MADDRIGVLLPVRLETRFLAPGERATLPGTTDRRAPDEWRVRLRVVPDEIWFDRHDPSVSDAERLALISLWSSVVTVPDAGDPAGSAMRAASDAGWYDAFARMAGQVGAARAAWLIRATPVRRTAGGDLVVEAADAPARAGSAVLRGFPSELAVWVQWTDADVPATIAVLHPRSQVIGRPLGHDEATWLGEWSRAVAAGMAAEISLGSRTPEEIAVLGVTGLGGGDGRPTPGDLFQAHADAGRLGVSGPGVATSTVHGAPVWTIGDDAATWHGTTISSDPTIDAIAGPGVTVAPVLGAGSHDESEALSRLLVGVTFPALWGFGFSAVLGIVEPGSLGDLWNWAAERLRPEGPFGTVRVGDLAYGVLPIAAPERVVPGDRLAEVHSLLPILARLGGAFAAAAEADAGVVDGGVADALRALRRGPVPGRMGVRRLVSTRLHAALSGDDPDGAMERWRSEHAASCDVVGGLPLKHYGSRTTQAWALAVPLVAPGLDDDIGPDDPSAAEPVVADIMSTIERLQAVRDDDEELFLVDPERQYADSLIARLYARSIAVAGATLNIVRQNQEIDAGADPLAMRPRPTLFEPDVAVGERTTVGRHIDDFFASGRLPREFEDAAVLHGLRWLCGEGGEMLVAHVDEIDSNPDLRRSLIRVLRGVLDASAGRWDPWFVAVAAAHLEDAHERGSVPTLGAYGWVDRPARGRPGPGPGGVILAPTLDHAATAAVLRDRAIRDVQPDRWDMTLDSAVVGPARRLLADVALGWHPAELIGRMLERHVGDVLVDDHEDRMALLARMREVAPLREGQGAFGCCHGFDLMARVQTPHPGDAAWPDVIADAVAAAGAVIDATGDLLLAEGVHGFVHGTPARAAAASEVLAGQIGARPLGVLDPTRSGRSVQTVVLAQLPPAVAQPDGGAVALASPGLARVVEETIGDGSSPVWTVSLVTEEGTSVELSLEDLGLSPADTVLVAEASIVDLAVLAARRVGDVAVSEGAVVGTGYAGARRLARALRGRCGVADDLRPHAAEAVDVREIQALSAAGLAERRDALAAAAADLAARATAAAEGLIVLQRAADLARAAGDEPAPMVVPAEAIDVVIAGSRWGFAPPPEVAQALDDVDTPAAQAAAVAVAQHLQAVAAQLGARLVSVGERDGELAGSLGRSDDPALDAPAAARSIAELIGRDDLPIGASLPASLLGGDLHAAEGRSLALEWLPAIAGVRPRLAELAADVVGSALHVLGRDVDDPWRLEALRDASPARLDVVVSAASALTPTGEWVVIDSFAEHVPDQAATMGMAFDAATPGASPPQAVLLVPPADPAAGLDAGDLPDFVLHARSLAHARMSEASTLVPAGLGPLMAYAALPQERLHGCPLAPTPNVPTRWTHDDVAVLLPGTARTDLDDVVGAVTADPLWMLGVQWRLGEHLGEDAASPIKVETIVERTLMEPALTVRPAESVVEDGWQPDDLCYSTKLAAPRATELSVTRHDGGPIDWWAVSHDGRQGTRSLRVSRALPGRMRWPGAPRRRFWQLDDVRRDPAGRGPDVSHPANLMLIELLARHGDDWYLAPVPTTIGGVVRPRRITVIDAAGGRWRLRCPNDWSFFAVAGLDPAPPDDPVADDPAATWHRALPVFAASASALASPPEEEVAVAVDEDANLIWCKVTGSGPTESIDPPIVLDGPAGGGGAVRWRLGERVPADRIPYVYGDPALAPAFGAGLDAFVRARLVDPETGDVVEPPASVILAPNGDGAQTVPTLRPLAVPASGVRIERRRMLAREVNGRPVSWVAHVRRPLDVAVDAPLRWDPLDPIAPVEPVEPP